MAMQNIPATFWHALSFCMVCATIGLLYIAYSSSSVSIEIANAKIELSSAISDAKDISGDLEAENRRLAKANELLEQRIKSLENPSAAIPQNAAAASTNTEIRKLIREPGATDWYQKLDTKIDSLQQVLKK